MINNILCLNDFVILCNFDYGVFGYLFDLMGECNGGIGIMINFNLL